MLKFKNLLILFALIAALLMPAGAWADEYFEVSSDNIAQLQTALNTEDSGDIVIDGDSSNTLILTASFDISRQVTIRAKSGTVTINSAAGARHFQISSGGDVTFENVNFTGGTNGGGLDVLRGGKVTFSNAVTFNSNSATGDGGAINSAGTVTFSKSATFTGNTASSNGGAINSSGTVSFADSATFTGNSATGNGGAINSAGTVEFNSTTAAPKFTGNSAANGGAINITAGTFKLTSTTDEQKFENNSATGSGGALNMAGGELTFPYTASFTSNDAGTSGGAVSVSAGTLGFTGAATFSKNAAASGGAVNTSGGTINFTRAADFKNNTSTGSDNGNGGGAIAISNGTINFTVSPSFESNTAARDGGAIYSNSGTLNFNDDATMSFTSNKAGNRGGAIYASALPSFKGSVSFNINTAAGNGGAVYISGTNGTAPDFGSGFMFYQNTTTDSSNGGAVYSERTLTLSGASFDANTAAGNGGAVYSAGNVKVESGTFANNTGELSGGVIYSTGTVEITGGDFTTANTANGTTQGSQGGGAVYAATVNITGTSSSPIKFTNQKASSSSGGAIYASSSLTATQAIFEDNQAASGGALYVLGSAVTLNNVSFVGNKTVSDSGADGGAIYSVSRGNTINNCYFRENTSVKDGGAIAVALDTATFNVAYSYFYNNTTGVSGGIHDYGGGAMYLYVRTATIDSCTFNGNRVAYGTTACGGAVSLANTSGAKIENSTFYNNIAMEADENNGGAVYSNGSGATSISFCTFTANKAQGTADNIHGGALFVNTGSLNIIGSIIVGNDTGGDIYKGNGNIISDGYNRVGRFATSSGYTNWDSNNAGRNSANDIADNGGSKGWSAEDFFGDETLKNNGGENAGAGSDEDYSCVVPTLALSESDPASTRAVDGARNLTTNVVIPNGSYPPSDQRGPNVQSRTSNAGAAPDIGAFEVRQDGSGDDSDNPYADYTIRSIKISGIPNTLSIVGQTAILHATVTYVNGTKTTTGEPLTWTLKDIEGSNAIRFSDNKNSKTSSSGSVYADGIGVSEITVSARDGAYKDSKKIYVIWHQQDTNIHPNVLNLVNQLNLQLSNDSINFYIMSAGYKDAVSDSSFKSAFKNAWGTEPKVIELNGSSFSSNANFSRAAQSKLDKAYSAGITANINNQETGAVLPVFCIWNFDLNDLDEDFNSNGDAIETMTDSEFSAWLFKNLNIGFEITGGEFLPAVSSSNQSSLQSAAFKDLVTAEDAVNSGALSVQRGENDVTVSMLAYIANVEPKGSTGSKLLTTSSNQKLLVIPGGNSAKNISGTIWTAEAASSSNNNNSNSNSGSSSGKKSGGGGGGGCDALGLGFIALAAIALKFKINKH